MSNYRVQLTDTQKAFVECPQLYPAYIAGFGAGKTTALVWKALDLKTKHTRSNGLIISPTIRDVRDTVLPVLRREMDRAGIEYTHVTMPFPEIRFPNGQIIMLRSGDDPESLKGPTVGWVGIDEIARIKKHIWPIAVSRARCPEMKRHPVFCEGTPEGRNWVYGKWAKDPQDEYVLFQGPTDENIYLSNPDEYIYGLTSSLTDEELEGYRYGQFTESAKGRVYKYFNYEKHVQESKHNLPLNGLTVQIACDFNVDYMSWLLAQTINGKTYIYDEIIGMDTTTFAQAMELTDRLRGFGGSTCVYGDASGKARSTAGRSDYETLRACGYRRQEIPRANPHVKDRISAVNVALRDERLFIYPKCERLINDLENVKWRSSREGMPTLDKSDGELTHSSDALGYLAMAHHKQMAMPLPCRAIDALRGRYAAPGL